MIDSFFSRWSESRTRLRASLSLFEAFLLIVQSSHLPNKNTVFVCSRGTACYECFKESSALFYFFTSDLRRGCSSCLNQSFKSPQPLIATLFVSPGSLCAGMDFISRESLNVISNYYGSQFSCRCQRANRVHLLCLRAGSHQELALSAACEINSSCCCSAAVGRNQNRVGAVAAVLRHRNRQ